MAAPDPIAVLRHARALAAALDPGVREALRVDTHEALVGMGITIDAVPLVAGECGLDGSYDPRTNTIRIDPAANGSRQRFTLLHELGHKQIDEDTGVNDWLWGLGDAQDHATEALADAFAAELLLPDDMVDELLPATFRARHVAALAAEATASREAVVVRAAQRLGGPGLVALADGCTVLFSSVRSLSFRTGRRVEQPEGSVFDRAAKYRRATAGREPIRLRSGPSYTTFDGDAQQGDDGYTYAVLRPSAPDLDRHGNEWGGTGPHRHPHPHQSPSLMSSSQLGHLQLLDACNHKRCPVRPPAAPKLCPEHHIALPATGVCDFCE